jgi:hypothetical protein
VRGNAEIVVADHFSPGLQLRSQHSLGFTGDFGQSARPIGNV